MYPTGTGAYPASWATDAVLADGQTVAVRPILASDAERLVRFHHRQSPESIYFRYFSPRPELSKRDVAHFTHVDHRDRVAFVALSLDEIIAVARYERYRGTNTAEVAFFVDDEHHGRGLASLMLEYLAAAGRENGIRRFVATTLPSNRKMLAVFHSAGYDVSSRLDEGVIEIGFDIDATDEALAAMDRRERAAEVASVRPMLEPTSVAVVGAGRRRGGLGAEVFRNLVDSGYRGDLYPVNRDATEVAGVVAFGSVMDLPEGIDLVVIATPAEDVPLMIEQCGERSVRCVAVLSAGFSEAGAVGADLEHAALEAARRHGLRMLGPNCMGVINADPDVRMNATLAPTMPPHGSVALLAEAGTLSASIVDHAERMELGVSTMVAAGNRADVSVTDLLSYWSDDESTTAVLLYLASRHLRPRFVRAARTASLQMPVAALHTAAVGTRDGRGDDLARRAQALFRQTGVIRVATLEQLFDVGRVVADQPVPGGSGVVVIGNSDGAVALAADACLGAGLELVAVEVTSPEGRVLGNPVDLSYTADASAFRAALGSVCADPRVHSVIVVYTPPKLAWDDDVVDVILEAAESSPLVTFAATMLGAAGRARLSRTRGDATTAVPIFRFPEDAAHALGRLAVYHSWRRSVGSDPADSELQADLEAACAVIAAARSAPGYRPGEVRALSHSEQVDLLGAYGIEMIERQVVDGVDDAVLAAERIGWPVALKASVRDRLTRSAASGVVLDIGDESQLRASWERMAAVLGEQMLPAVVQRFADSGVDVAVQIERESDGTGTVTVGLGGPAAIAGEQELGVLPLRLSDASTLVATSAVGRVLTDPLDRVPVVDLVHRLAALADQHDEIHRIHADPVVTSLLGALVADVEVWVGDPLDDMAVRRLE